MSRHNASIVAAGSRFRAHFRFGLLAAGCAFAFAAPPSTAAARPLETAITDGGPFHTEPETAFQRVRAAGARSVRIYAGWSSVAPAGDEKPDGFDPRDPADPAYDWSVLDRQVRAAAASGVSPILAIEKAPLWAVDSDFRRGVDNPDPREFGNFAFAAARRYSGSFAGLPRVRRWQAWNEPNLSHHLLPQYNTPISEPVSVQSRPRSPSMYRRLLNAFASAVRRVHSDNVVIAGGLAPFGRYEANDHGVAPLQFMRKLLCLSPRNKPRRKCKRPSFDVWSVHPYTQGGPTVSAQHPDNVSLGDVPEVRRALRAAINAGNIRTKRRVEFWITEISWDTKPPDPGGVPLKLHARWVSEMLYRMWRNHVRLVTWFQLRDAPDPEKPKGREFTSGLYFACSEGFHCDTPKPSLQAFRFPFVAFRKGGKTARVWGRTPTSRHANVRIQQSRGGRWRRVARVRADRHGIFKGKVRVRKRGELRAVGVGDRSQPFSLKRPRDLRVNPFGGCYEAEAEDPVCRTD